MVEKLSFTLALEGLTELADEIADLENDIIAKKAKRDDMIRDAIRSGIPKTRVSIAADLSVEQIYNIQHRRYTVASRKLPRRKENLPVDDQ